LHTKIYICNVKNRKLLGIEMGRLTPEEYRQLPQEGIVVVLDNIRSAHNAGSVFRSCDAFKADKVYLCGITPVPPSAEIHKSALGAEFSVPWEHCPHTLEVVGRLKAEGYVTIAVEQTVNSLELGCFVREKGRKYAFIFGNEVDGVSQDVVDASDMALEIPQRGTKHSLNVSVAAGVVLWHATAGCSCNQKCAENLDN
jgi:tRNA G18 (ribose-2'-O)-methylase SpoU